MRKTIAGNTPNMKNHLYRMMEFAKDASTYSENFQPIGCLDDSQLKIIRDNSKTETSFIINTLISQCFNNALLKCFNNALLKFFNNEPP